MTEARVGPITRKGGLVEKGKTVMPTHAEWDVYQGDTRVWTPEVIAKGIDYILDRKPKEVKEPPKPEGGKFATYVDPRISKAARQYAGSAVDRLAYGLAAYDALAKGQKIEHLPPEEMVRRYKNHEGFEEGDTNYIGAGSLRDMLVRLVHESKAKKLRKERGVSHYKVHPEVIATQEADAEAYRSEASRLMKHPLARHLFI